MYNGPTKRGCERGGPPTGLSLQHFRIPSRKPFVITPLPIPVYTCQLIVNALSTYVCYYAVITRAWAVHGP